MKEFENIDHKSEKLIKEETSKMSRSQIKKTDRQTGKRKGRKIVTQH